MKNSKRQEEVIEMKKSNIIITSIVLIIFSAVLSGLFLTYNSYTSPMYVEDIEEAIEMLKDNSSDGNSRIFRLAMYNELARSNKMHDRKTNKIRKFSKKEMEYFYENTGGKESIINYIKEISDDEQRRKELEFAHDLKIITNDEYIELWNY